MKPNKEKKQEGKITLTKEIECEWCGAKKGEPCKIQPPVGYRGHPTDYILGNNKTYFEEERVHLIRAK